MSTMEHAVIGHNSNIKKWVTLGMMHKADQVHDIAQMLEATMEDLSEQMENLDEKMELLEEAVEMIQEQMEEIMDILNGEVDPDALPPSEMYETNPLPF
jgi:predicted  nucleic acid-binding Zn-ribbon protein